MSTRMIIRMSTRMIIRMSTRMIIRMSTRTRMSLQLMKTDLSTYTRTGQQLETRKASSHEAGTCTRTTGIQGHLEVEVMARRKCEDESWLKVRARREQDAEGHIEFQIVAGPRRGVYQITFVRGDGSCPHVQFLCAGRHAN